MPGFAVLTLIQQLHFEKNGHHIEIHEKHFFFKLFLISKVDESSIQKRFQTSDISTLQAFHVENLVHGM